MSAAHSLPAQIFSEPVPRKRFTRSELGRVLSVGVFEGQRLELIDGDLLDKTGQNPRHAFAMRLVLNWIASFIAMEHIQVQLPVEMAGPDQERSEPEPDIAVLAELKAEYQQRHPRGDELLLAIEIADSSAAFDLSRKASLYAASRIPEYWVLDLGRRMLVVHRQSDGAQYRQIQMYSEAEPVSMEGRSETTLVGPMLPAQ